MSYIPYGRQDISQADIDAVLDVLTSDWLTQGPSIEVFEKGVADYCNAQYAVAVSNGTAALHLGCLAMGLGKGDWLWTVPNTFVASANCGLFCGAKVDFVDIDAQTLNMDVALLADKLAIAKQSNCLPKIVIPVHFSGRPCNMPAIKVLADEYGFYILEDASHAIGSSWDNVKTGSCQWSDATVFSFHPVKIITTGEGGMLVTNNSDIAQKMAALRTHGITRNPLLLQNKDEGPWYYEQQSLGYNYRITDMQCALGASQLQRLGEFVDKRKQLVAEYNNLLVDLPVMLPTECKQSSSSWHLYVIQLEEVKKRGVVFEALRKASIGVNVHYIPVHLQPWYKQFGFKLGDFPVSEKHYQSAISLPMYPALTTQDQKRVEEELSRLLG